MKNKMLNKNVLMLLWKADSQRIPRLQNSDSSLNIINCQLNALFESIPTCFIFPESIYKMRYCHLDMETYMFPLKEKGIKNLKENLFPYYQEQVLGAANILHFTCLPFSAVLPSSSWPHRRAAFEQTSKQNFMQQLFNYSQFKT